MRFKRIIAAAMIFIALSGMGCAFGHYGKANTGYFNIDLPQVAEGATKLEVIRTFGVPDSTVNFEGTDYWRYRNVSGWFILLGGITREKDLVIEFKAGEATSSYVIDKGASIGILMLQGAVAN